MRRATKRERRRVPNIGQKIGQTDCNRMIPQAAPLILAAIVGLAIIAIADMQTSKRRGPWEK